MREFKKKGKIFFLILSFFFTLSCSGLKDSFLSKPQNKTHLNIKISFSNLSKISSLEPTPSQTVRALEEAYASVQKDNYLTSVRFVIHSSSLDQPIQIFETYNLSERRVDEPYYLSLPGIQKSEILIQYLGSVSHPLRYGERFFYGSISLNLTQDAHHVEIKSRVFNEFKKEILFGGRYIDENLSAEDLTGKVVAYFHPPNGDPKIPFFEKEIFGGWFYLLLPVLKEGTEENALFSYEMKKNGEKLFPLLNEKIFQKMDEKLIHTVELPMDDPAHLENENEIKIQVGGKIESIEDEAGIEREERIHETETDTETENRLGETNTEGVIAETTSQESSEEVLKENEEALEEKDHFKREVLFLKISKPLSFEVPFEFLSLDPLFHQFIRSSNDANENSFFHQESFFKKPNYSAYLNPEKTIYFGFFRKSENPEGNTEDLQFIELKENEMCDLVYFSPFRRILNSFDIQEKLLSLTSYFFNPLIHEIEDQSGENPRFCRSSSTRENLFSLSVVPNEVDLVVPNEVDPVVSDGVDHEDAGETHQSTQATIQSVQETSHQNHHLDFITKNHLLNLQEGGSYSSRFFGFYGPFQLIDPNDFYQPFVKAYFIKDLIPITESDTVEESQDKIRLEWKFLKGLKQTEGIHQSVEKDGEEIQDSITLPLSETPLDRMDPSEVEGISSVVDGVSIFAKNISEFENLFYTYASLDFLNHANFISFYPSNLSVNLISDLDSGTQKMSFLLLNPYRPDEAMEVSCNRLHLFGWKEIAHVEEDSFYDFTNDGNLDLKSAEGIKKAKNWKFIFCPYKKRSNEIQYYSSFVRKLKIEENTFEFERINHFSRKESTLLRESISIENEDAFFTGDLIQGAHGRITNITEISLEERNIHFKGEDFTFILEIPNKKGDFKIGDELLLHISNASLNENSSACSVYRNQPAQIGMWSLGEILKIEDEKFYIHSDSFLKNINPQYLTSSDQESSFCLLQAVKIVELKKLYIKNGGLITEPIDFKFGGGMIALRINEELHLEGGKIKANHMGFENRNSVIPEGHESTLVGETERAHQGAEIFDSVPLENLTESQKPLLIFGNSYIKKNQERVVEDEGDLIEGPDHSSDAELILSGDEVQKRGGGIIFLAAKEVYLSKSSDSFQNTLEVKGRNQGGTVEEPAGSIYFLTKKVEIKDRAAEEPLVLNEEDPSTGNASAQGGLEENMRNFDFSSLLLDASSTGGFIYSLSCSHKNIVPFVGKDLDTEGSLLNAQTDFYGELKTGGDKNWIQILLFPFILNENAFSFQRLNDSNRLSFTDLLNTGFIKFQKLLCNPFFMKADG